VKKTPRLPPAYRQLARQLATLGFVSQGSVLERAPGQQGSRYVWTRKLKAKTVTVALSEAQYHWLKQAVANQRELERIVEQMQIMSRQTLFENVPGVLRRKQLTKKVLGLN
jgi:virulence-associated protein VapD